MIDFSRPFDIIPEVVVPRAEWGATPPASTETYKEYPILWVTVRFTESEECYNKEECSRVLREVQERDMRAGEPDILHNFMVGGDFAIYEGRGWKNVAGKPLTEDVRGVSLDVAYIGPSPYLGQRNYPTLEMKHAYHRILVKGVRRGLLDSNYNKGTFERVLTSYEPQLSDLDNSPL